MDHDGLASSLTQRAKFDIDLEQLGIFLAEAFIKRLDAFVPEDRITMLKACHKRLASEGGDLVEHLLAGSSHQHPGKSISPDVRPAQHTQQIPQS